MNQQPNKISAFVGIFIIIGFIIIATGCDDGNSNKSTSAISKKASTKVADTTAITSPPIKTIHKPHVKYQIILTDHDSYGYINKLMVYTKSMDSKTSESGKTWASEKTVTPI